MTGCQHPSEARTEGPPLVVGEPNGREVGCGAGRDVEGALQDAADRRAPDPAPRTGEGDAMSAEAIAIVGAAVGVLAVLVPLLLAQGRLDRMDARIDRIDATLHALAERVARIGGALTGPWRPPANGGQAAPADPAPSAPAPEANR